MANNTCSAGSVYRKGYTRKAYTRKDGTKVKAAKVKGGCIEKQGLGKGKRVEWTAAQMRAKAKREAEASARTKSPRSAKEAKCKRGEILRDATKVKAYTRKDGTRVEEHYRAAACIRDLGLPGKGSQLIGPLKKGTLSQFGYAVSKPDAVRHWSLKAAVNEYSKPSNVSERQAAMSVYRKLTALSTLTRNTQPANSRTYTKDVVYMKRQYGL